MKNLLEEFINKKKSLGVPEDDIQKAVFVALNYATLATINEIKGKVSPQIKNVLEEVSKNPKDTANVLYQEDFINAKLEGSEETVSDVVNKHLKDFLANL